MRIWLENIWSISDNFVDFDFVNWIDLFDIDSP